MKISLDKQLQQNRITLKIEKNILREKSNEDKIIRRMIDATENDHNVDSTEGGNDDEVKIQNNFYANSHFEVEIRSPTPNTFTPNDYFNETTNDSTQHSTVPAVFVVSDIGYLDFDETSMLPTISQEIRTEMNDYSWFS